LKFRIFLKETEILQSPFESTESERQSQQSTSQVHESQVLYH